MRGLACALIPSWLLQLLVPPREYCEDLGTLKKFLERMDAEGLSCMHFKVVVVGVGNSGKTTVVQSLFKNKLTTSSQWVMRAPSQRQRETAGVVTCPVVWSKKNKSGEEDNYALNFFDFAGQRVCTTPQRREGRECCRFFHIVLFHVSFCKKCTGTLT